MLASCKRDVQVEICRYQGGKEAAVSLTFDDGIADHLEVARHLDSLGLRATFWLNPSVIGQIDDYAPRLTWDDCRLMAAAGHELSNHSWSHPNFLDLTPDEILREVSLADEAIEREIGRRPTTFCYPYNAWNRKVDRLVSKDRVGLRYFEEGQGQTENHSTLESLCRWADSIADSGSWGVTMSHGVHYGWDHWNDPEVLWNYFRYLASLPGRLWIAPFCEVSAYLKERDETQVLVDVRPFSVVLTPECPLDSTLYREPLTVRILSPRDTLFVRLDPHGGPQRFRF